MAPKSRSKKSTALDTGKKRGKQTAKRKNLLPEFSPNHTWEPSHEYRPSLIAIMDLLIDISSRLSTNEQYVYQMRAEKMAEEESRP